MKNTNSIDKIIASLSARDCEAAARKLSKSQRRNILFGKSRFSYSLGAETLEAIETKKAYLAGEIGEEEYKAFCLNKWLNVV